MKAPRPAPTFFERITKSVGSPTSVIIHTAFFISVFLLGTLGLADWDMVLLVLTTLVSLEAIYLAIFIQMSVNQQARELEEVSEDIEDIQENVEEISEDVEDIQEDIDEIQEDVEEISEDVDEIQEDVEELSEEEAETTPKKPSKMKSDQALAALVEDVKKILAEIEALKGK